MRQFVQVLKNLYSNKLVDKDKIVDLFTEGKITLEEKNYILG